VADERVEVVHDDAFTWTARQARQARRGSDRFDVVIVDTPDPDRLDLVRLYSAEMYRAIGALLAPGGRMVVQTGSTDASQVVAPGHGTSVPLPFAASPVSIPSERPPTEEARVTTDTTEEYRRASYEISQAIAPGWERWRSHFEAAVVAVRDWMVRELAPHPGATVLELAAGAGDTGFQAAAVAGGGGHLISTDLSPAMLDVGRRRAAELGLENVDFRVMDAERLDLDADSVDGVLCRFGYMLLADPAAAFAQTRRVLRRGGRLTLAVWAAPERNPFFTIVASTLVASGHMPAPDPTAPGPFSMSSAERTQGLLQAAGFDAVRIDEVPVRFRFRDLDEYLGFMADTAGPIAIVLRGLSNQEQDALTVQLGDPFRRFATDAGYEIPAAALVAVAS
jgi:ubiquinone/menaquinone biosynthesis C-methylase UbiE